MPIKISRIEFAFLQFYGLEFSALTLEQSCKSVKLFDFFSGSLVHIEKRT